jgi:transcriptional regulator GlxA family with amidase domain
VVAWHAATGGVTSGLDLALWLVERFAGEEVAEKVAREMEHQRVGTVWRKPFNK